MTFWYLGSPYSKYPDGLDAAFEAVCIEAGRLIAASIPIYSPIAHTHPIAHFSKMDKMDHDIWIPVDKPLMKAASGLIVLELPSWKISTGLRYEIEFFKFCRKPIVHMVPGTIPQELLHDAESDM